MEFIQSIFSSGFEAADLIAFLLILVLDGVLSIDNAAVLAVIVQKNFVEKEDRAKALRYGILGAYFFRGLCLFGASWLINNPEVGLWFKLAGGLYLVYLAYKGLFIGEEDNKNVDEPKWVVFLKWLGVPFFWIVVAEVEFIDIVFSMDNLVAVIAVSNKMWVVWLGVFASIAIMRFIAVAFTSLMEKYPSLVNTAYIVILILGLKLVLSSAATVLPQLHPIGEIMERESFDFIFSGVTILIFALPIISKYFEKKRGTNTISE